MNPGSYPLNHPAPFAFGVYSGVDTAFTSGNGVVIPFQSTVYDFNQCFDNKTYRAKLSKPGIYAGSINVIQLNSQAPGQLVMWCSTQPRPTRPAGWDAARFGWDIMSWDFRTNGLRSNSVSFQTLIESTPCELWIEWIPTGNGTLRSPTNWQMYLFPTQIP